MRVMGMIVAAGLSTRMKQFKPIMEIEHVSMIQRILDTYQKCGVEKSVIVVGYKSEVLKKHLSQYPVIFIENHNYEKTEMFDSAKMGLAYLQGKCDKILFSPADVPLFSEKTVRKLLETDSMLAKPSYNKKGGHPLLISKDVISTLLNYNGDGGLKAALHCCSCGIHWVNVEDEGILLDADTREDFEKLLIYEKKLK